MRHSIAPIVVRAEIAPTPAPPRVIRLRRPHPTYCPALPRFEVRPAGRYFEVIDGFSCVLGSYLTSRGAEQARIRLTAAIARAALIDSPYLIAECVGADHPHSADISYPTPTLRDLAPTEVDYSDYRDVPEGADAGPTDEDWADYHAHRAERDFHPAELDEMRIRHLDVFA